MIIVEICWIYYFQYEYDLSQNAYVKYTDFLLLI